MITEKTPAVLIVVTIDAEVFPVGAIRGDYFWGSRLYDGQSKGAGL